MIARNTPVPVSCLDKPRSLLFSLNAAAIVKQETGENPLSWNQEGWASLAKSALGDAEPQKFIAVLRAMLLHEDSALTASQVGEMLTSLPQMREIFAAMAQAYMQFVGPITEVGDSEDPSRAQTPTSSGQLVATT